MKKLLLFDFSSFVILFFLSLVFSVLLGGNEAKADYCGKYSGDTTSGCYSANSTKTTCKNDTANVGCSWYIEGNADDNKFVDTICNILDIATGNGGKAFAAFAIISLGIGFFTGKVSWGLMIGVACGIGAMFGAPTIVAAISGEDAFSC